MNAVLDKIIVAGKEGGWLLALIVAGAALGLTLLALPSAGVDTTPLSDDKTVKVVAASGEAAYTQVLEFCQDPLTTVAIFPAPDAGETWQLTRARAITPEVISVVVSPDGTINQDFARYQGSETKPAIISDRARDCIERRAGR